MFVESLVDFYSQTNPGPIGIYSFILQLSTLKNIPEKALCQDPHIKGSVVFGRAKFQNGVLIDPKTEYAFDPKDEIKLEEFRNAIWYIRIISMYIVAAADSLARPTVERMNISAPQHSRIFKEVHTFLTKFYFGYSHRPDDYRIISFQTSGIYWEKFTSTRTNP